MPEVQLDRLRHVVTTDGFYIRSVRQHKQLGIFLTLSEKEAEFYLHLYTEEGLEILEMGNCDLQTATQSLLKLWDSAKLEAMLRNEGKLGRQRNGIPLTPPHPYVTVCAV